MDLKTIKNLLKKYHFRPSKRLGQNFLIDKKVLRKIIETAELQPDDFVLEIGPGIGNLTQELAKRVKKIIAVEKDQKMIEILKETLNHWKIKNVKIIQSDVLNLKSETLNLKPYKLVANLPYYIVGPTIRKFLEEKNPPKLMVLMVQKEVAQRICAKPPRMSLLAVSVQFYAKPEIVSFVPKKCFWPSPRVDSSIIKIVSRQFRVQVSRQFRERFFKIVRAGFSQPRKQIVNNLTKMLALSQAEGLALILPNRLKSDKEKVKNWLLKNKIQPSQRAETLEMKDWINLAKN